MDVNIKTCTNCRKQKTLDNFYKKSGNKDGLQGNCIQCHKEYYQKNKKSIKKSLYKWRNKNPEKVIQQQLRTRYKINKEESVLAYDVVTNGTCMICGKKPKKRRLHLDHCHTTGKIRGALCSNCNSAIGKLQESPTLFQNALNYISNPPGISS